LRRKSGGPDLVTSNIDRVLGLEAQAAERRSVVQLLANAVGRFVGTFAFALGHLALIGLWIAVNTGAILHIRHFDPFPFSLLSTIASCEAVVLTAFVLMKQSRESELADRREHLHLQVNLIAEQEISLLIQMLDRISRKLEVPQDGETETALHLSRTATLDNVVEQLHARWPDAAKK
jgi:uncharacterized membrane protein